MTLINKMLILNNIDNLKTSITEIKTTQAVENNFYNEKISSIESQIAELNDKISLIKSEKELFNEETNSRILEKKESLNSNLSKLDIIMR